MTLTPIQLRKWLFALIMAGVTGTMTCTMGTLRNHGWQPGFMQAWLHTFEFVYPTIVFSILVLAPHVHRLLDRLLPDVVVSEEAEMAD